MLESFIRALHVAPRAPEVDIYANDQLIANNLSYGQYSDYIPVPQGNYTITVYAAGSRINPILSNTLMINPQTIQTIAVVSTLETLELRAIADRSARTQLGKPWVRFLHLSPNAPAVDLTLPDGTILFGDVSYQRLTPYMVVDPMNYTVQLRLAGTPTVVLTEPNVNLLPGMVYSIYAIGLVGEEPELSLLLAEDGMTRDVRM